MKIFTGLQDRCQMTVMKMACPHRSVTAAMKSSEDHKLNIYDTVRIITFAYNIILWSVKSAKKTNMGYVFFIWSDSYELDNVERILCSDLRMWRRLSGKYR